MFHMSYAFGFTVIEVTREGNAHINLNKMKNSCQVVSHRDMDVSHRLKKQYLCPCCSSSRHGCREKYSKVFIPFTLQKLVLLTIFVSTLEVNIQLY